MTTTKRVNLDEEIDKQPKIEVFQPEDIEDPPMTCEVPEGWSGIFACDGGDCWYQRVKVWEARFGKKFLPLKYAYDQDGNIVLSENIIPPEQEGEENGDSD